MNLKDFLFGEEHAIYFKEGLGISKEQFADAKYVFLLFASRESKDEEINAVGIKEFIDKLKKDNKELFRSVNKLIDSVQKDLFDQIYHSPLYNKVMNVINEFTIGYIHRNFNAYENTLTKQLCSDITNSISTVLDKINCNELDYIGLCQYVNYTISDYMDDDKYSNEVRSIYSALYNEIDSIIKANMQNSSYNLKVLEIIDTALQEYRKDFKELNRRFFKGNNDIYLANFLCSITAYRIRLELVAKPDITKMSKLEICKYLRDNLTRIVQPRENTVMTTKSTLAVAHTFVLDVLQNTISEIEANQIKFK